MLIKLNWCDSQDEIIINTNYIQWYRKNDTNNRTIIKLADNPAIIVQENLNEVNDKINKTNVN